MTPTAAEPAAAHERAWAWLLGLHGLALMAVFPLGPQEARLWHPGVSGVAAMVAAFPAAALAAGLVARRLVRLPATPRACTVLAMLGLLPSVLSTGYTSFLIARVIAGLVAGVSVVAIHRQLYASADPLVGRRMGRIVAFGMPVSVLSATLLDWRAVSAPILIALGWLLTRAPSSTRPANASREARAHAPGETAPAAVLTTGALTFVSASYLTVLSGFLVFNAGHRELLISAVLLTGALLGLAVPVILARFTARTNLLTAWHATMAVSAAGLVGLLALRDPLPAGQSVGLIAAFLALNTARHGALAALTRPHLDADGLPAHRVRMQLAHYAGCALGAVAACLCIHPTSTGTLAGMPALLVISLAAGVVAVFAGRTLAQPKASPAAAAASPSNR